MKLLLCSFETPVLCQDLLFGSELPPGRTITLAHSSIQRILSSLTISETHLQGNILEVLDKTQTSFPSRE